jgi:hypothetical protein
MSRIGLAAVVAGVVGVSLTGCVSAALDSLSSNSSSEQFQALNFESNPPGAEIHTIQGQTCITPCELTVLSQEQRVTISKKDYLQQSVDVTVGPQPDHSFWQNPPPTLVPNPVHVELQPVPKPIRHARSHKPVSAPARNGLLIFPHRATMPGVSELGSHYHKRSPSPIQNYHSARQSGSRLRTSTW